ncbi:carbohydrate binding protein [Actinoplanes xinjiangensis]|uniref:galactosylceramidase n=1 Tax=Actinoplanes xinjiangensis TaxID=512350 RepID=A0A316FKE5_9ACTN|nr:carbohydrate binding protein [Actinoplanes xinjiangensis]
MNTRRRRRWTAGCAAVSAALAWTLTAVPATAADDPVDVIVDGLDVRADNVHGLPYKGLGLISANSTSNLLMDYKAEQPGRYWQLIDVLFGGARPLINHVKVEMGSDTNNSTGSDAATMRTATEPADASRSPGFQLAADAKTVNPRLKVSILRWTMPYWVQSAWSAGTGRDEMYRWYKETILDAYEKYGYMVDYVNPDTNETTNPDLGFIKYWKNAVVTDTDFADPRYGIPAGEQAAVAGAYRKIKVVASDENQTKNIGPALLDDPALFEIVDAVGYHYNTDDRYDGAPGGNTYEPYTKLATLRDKEVWYSEGVGSFGFTDYRVNNNEGPGGASTGIGGLQSALDLANRSVKGYHRSKRTHYIFQPAIGSFYEGAQYSHKELLSARDPWSGMIHYDAAIHVMRHFTRFATTGWENDTNTAGIWRTVPEASYSGVSGTENLDGSNGAASYLTLAAPDRTDFSTIAVNDSDLIKTYRIRADNMDLGADPALKVWETRAAHHMRLVDTLRPAGDGYYTYQVPPRSIVTFTTLDAEPVEPLPETLPRTVLDTDATGKTPDTRDTVLYADDFDYAEEGDVKVGGQTRPYLASRGGEPRYLVDQTGAWQVDGDVLYQLMDQSMKDTAAWNRTTPNTLVGDFHWQNYKAGVDVSFPDPAGGSAGLGVRQQSGMTADSAAYLIRINRAGTWTFSRHGTTVATGTRPPADGYHLAVEAKGATVTAFVDGTAVHSWTDPTPELAGRVNLSSDFHRTGFDNLRIEKIKGFSPYAVSLVDNMDGSLAYTGTWSHRAASGDAMDWHRSTSTGTTAGATVTAGFTGTGLDLIGGNTGTATLDVTVDGKPLAAGATTRASGKRQATYTLRGLADGPHTATFTLRSGTLVLDAVTAISGDVDGPVDTTPVRDALTAAGDPVEADWSPQSWAVFAATRDQATAASNGRPGLDTVGVAQIAARLTAAADDLRPADVTDTRRDLGLAGAVPTRGDLPATVVIDGRPHQVTWTAASRRTTRAAYTTVTLEGWTNDAYADGRKQAFTVRYEVVPPSLVYYIDAGLAAGQSSPQFQAVSGSVTTLRNGSADQISAGAGDWGHVADGITVKGGTDPADKYSTGTWAGSNKTIRYRLPLDPGRYVLTAGFTEWWGQNRPMSQNVTVGGTTVTGTPVTLNATSTRATGTVSFTVGTPTVVTYTVAKTGSQDPVISWLAVNRTTPDAPAGVTAVAGDTTAQVTWAAPDSDGGSPITGYTVTASPGDATCTATDVSGCRVPGLVNGTAYTFTVVAHNGAGTSPHSAPSAPVTPFWVPKAVTVTGPAEVTPGRQVTLVAGVEPAQADPAVTWQSSNPAVASVSAGGVVTGIAHGSAVITATSAALPHVSASHRIEVVPAAWSATTVYTTGSLVRHDGRNYAAQWWTRGQTPGTSPWGAWAEVGTPVTCGTGSHLGWTTSWIYTGGEVVHHEGRLWQAKWWTRNQEPGDPYGPWHTVGGC